MLHSSILVASRKFVGRCGWNIVNLLSYLWCEKTRHIAATALTVMDRLANSICPVLGEWKTGKRQQTLWHRPDVMSLVRCQLPMTNDMLILCTIVQEEPSVSGALSRFHFRISLRTTPRILPFWKYTTLSPHRETSYIGCRLTLQLARLLGLLLLISENYDYC